MKRKWLVILGVVALLGVVGLTACSSGDSPTTGGTTTGATVSGQTSIVNVGSQQQGISVTGQGKVTVVPDIATLQLGIEAQESTVAQAQQEAATAMNKVMTSLTNDGVAKNDIKTQTFSITQVTQYDNKTQKQIIIGYRVDNMVIAKIRTLDKVGSIIDDVAAAGGDLTRINSISFSVDDPTPYYTQARKAAMADAQSKASQLANEAGVGLGKPTFISDSTYTPPVPSPVVTMAEAPALATTPISPGSMDITDSVQITYAIK